jgi:hypothetical protein
MKKCESCDEVHDSKYGSGRFCSPVCARSYSTRDKRIEINEKVKLKLQGLPRKSKICISCSNEFIPKIRRPRKTCSLECLKNIMRLHSGHDKVDWSEVNKKAYKEGKNFISGGTTKWIQYKDIKVQGTYEYKMCEILDSMVENKSIISWEYSTVRIPYIGEDNKKHTYIVDFLVNKKDKKYLIEVKGREIPNDVLKWEAAISLGWDLRVWRKSDIFKK